MTLRNLPVVVLVCLLSACEPGAEGDGYTAETLSSRCLEVQSKYRDLDDLHKYTIKRTCASGANSCHFNEVSPPMHTVSLFWSMINMPCNSGVPDYTEYDVYCQSSADGGNDGVLVEPGDADQSYLMIRLRGDTRTTRLTMPLNNAALTPEEIYVFEAWINGLELGLSTPEDLIDYSKTICPF
ncbi:hypothetical protein MNBD_GAMMA09-2441 [hydrothermal vent metagenome]|uniref:Lipoprotein n=1 Tax=hydrothermal vent metagenome TaxID=652676 RepID=A0A3B0YQJ5_9ZZZZ